MGLTELVGITINIDFEYKSHKQKEKLHSLLWSNNQVNKLFADMLSMMSEDFFNREMEKLNAPKDKYKITIDSRITNDPDIDELLDWVSLDIDIITNATNYDNIFSLLQGNAYEDTLIDIFKKNIINYFSKVPLDEPMSIKIEITEIGGN